MGVKKNSAVIDIQKMATSECITDVCDKKWCRDNAARWMPDAFDILFEAMSGAITVQLDALSPDFLRTILSQSIEDEHTVDMHVDNAISLGIDGKFSDLEPTSDPGLLIAGLSSDGCSTLDRGKRDLWERWGFVEDVDFAPWRPEYVLFRASQTTLSASHISSPSTTFETAGQMTLDRQMATGVAVSLMTDKVNNKPFKDAKLFFSFAAKTEPWEFGKRKALASILNALTRITEGHQMSGWLKRKRASRRHSSSTTEWTYPPLGPCQPPWSGGIHVTLGKNTWHSVLRCTIGMSEDPTSGASPVMVSVITAW